MRDYSLVVCFVLSFAACSSQRTANTGEGEGVQGKGFELAATAVSPNVQNGSAFEVGRIELMDCKTAVVPEYADVHISEATDYLIIFTKKTLDYKGHPSERLDIRAEYKRAGCAWKVRAGTMTIATYGEWWSKEGGLRMSLKFMVPPSVTIREGKGLSGEKSAACPSTILVLEQKHPSGSPAPGWTKVVSEFY